MSQIDCIVFALGDIVGMNSETWQSLEIEKKNPVYIFDSQRNAHPIKLESRYRPVVYHMQTISQVDTLETKGMRYLIDCPEEV